MNSNIKLYSYFQTEKSSEKGTGSKTRAEKPAANLPSKRRSKKRMWGNWAAKDTEEYRNRYPVAID